MANCTTIHIPDDDTTTVYTALCGAALFGSLLSVCVSLRVVVGFNSKLSPVVGGASLRSSRMSLVNDTQRLRDLALDRHAWLARLHNPLSKMLVTVVLVQGLQAAATAFVAVAALTNPSKRCYVTNPSAPCSPEIAPHIVYWSHACDISALIDVFFDSLTTALLAWFLALIAFPWLHAHEPLSSNCRQMQCFNVAMVSSMAFAIVWPAATYLAMPTPSPGRSKFHRWLPWCWSPHAKTQDQSWEVARVSVLVAGIVLFVVLGAAASFRARYALRQYRRAVTHRWSEPSSSSPLASFIRSKELPKRIKVLALLCILMVTLVAAWRLAPLPTAGSDAGIGVLALVMPCNAALMGALWAACEGVFTELFSPMTHLSWWMQCLGGSDAMAAQSDTASSTLLASVEPLPFTHIVLTANRYVERRKAERRWLHDNQSESDAAADSEREEDPSRVLTTGPSPVP